jgi:quinolinate synthase
MSETEMGERIHQRKNQLSDRLCILGHHYQQDDVIEFADHTGDSLKLSQIAAQQGSAEYVVFCGVHFMAETADMLTSEKVRVILPDLAAGCSMADMAQIDQLENAWDHLTAATDAKIVPITYVNSTAAVKAFCGGHDGACCTSSNARLILESALSGHLAENAGDENRKVLFLPDQHLGRNTAFALGYPLDSMAVYDPTRDNGGLTDEQIRDTKFLLWKGHCSVHQLFTPAMCDEIRETDPDCTIIVHPECSWEVVQKADLSGSTEYIIKTVTDAPAGTSWAVGTEVHLINRLADQLASKKNVRSLARIQCLCTTMYRIDRRHLLWTLDNLADGRVVNQISVDPETRTLGVLALNRMLSHIARQPVSAK